MTHPPAWRVDPEGPAAPQLEDDDELYPIEERLHLQQPAPPNPDPLASERAELKCQLADTHTERTRLLFQQRRLARLTKRRPGPPPPALAPAHRPPFELAPGAVPGPRPGHPGHKARNDRLLALFEKTPTHLPHLQRCRMAARALAAEIASQAGVPVERVRVMPATTARDAIAEARRRSM